MSYQELQAADNLARFACAVYAVAPVAENQYVPCAGALSLLPAYSTLHASWAQLLPSPAYLTFAT